ncbi:DUF4157 domain-containing protein [Streptomyces zaomyceticus]|uniref:eCIS core domain-containing protein n=1 Tax=Streptomyces zaomyceticus TaxID=68286 RepID=UPI003990B5A6
MRPHDSDSARDSAGADRSVPRGPSAPSRWAPDDTPRTLAHLQRTAGNAAVVQLLRQSGHLGNEERHQHGAGCGHAQGGPPAVQRSAVHGVLRTSGRPLDDGTRTDMESRFGGADFSDVRVHDDGAARASAAEIGARAYTSGSHIVLGGGGGDRHTLAHELTHVVQQRQGPVSGTDHGNGLQVSDPSDRFEREAEANATRVLSGSAPVHETVGATAPVHGSDAPSVQRAERSDNPHAKGTAHEGWPTTAHHVVGHSQVTKALDSVAGHHREMLLRQAVPEEITEDMLRNLAIKIPEHSNGAVFRKRLRAALVGNSKSAATAFPEIDFGATRRAFYEWQGGNQFVGPNTSMRAEPTDNGDDTDYDGLRISPLPEADFHRLAELGDKLKEANRAGNKDAQYQLMRDILSITANVTPNPFDSSLWTEVGDAEEVDRLARVLNRSHMRKYTYFKLTKKHLDEKWFAGITRNPKGNGFLYSGEPLESPFEKDSFLYLKSDDKQKTPVSEVPLLDVVSGVKESDGFTEFDLPPGGAIDGNLLSIPGYSDKIFLQGMEAVPSGRCRIKTPAKPKLLTPSSKGMELSEYCRLAGVPVSTFLPKALVDANS